MNIARKTWWLWLVLSALAIFGVSQYLLYVKHKSDPCVNETVDALSRQYPQLNDLRERHQAETAKLLAMHRQQDVMVNLQMSTEQVSPEEALRISIGQIDQVAVLRKRQHDQFDKLCHEVVSNRQ